MERGKERDSGMEEGTGGKKRADRGWLGSAQRMPPGKSGVPGPRRRESNPQRRASGLEDGAGDWQRRFPPTF